MIFFLVQRQSNFSTQYSIWSTLLGITLVGVISEWHVRNNSEASQDFRTKTKEKNNETLNYVNHIL